jgi:hypothetical protein
MKWIAALLAFTLSALIAWPYVYLWRLDNAVIDNDLRALEQLVDLRAVRAQVKSDFGREVDGAVGNDGGKVMRWVKQGIGLISDTAIDANIDMPWVVNALGKRPGDPPIPRTSLITDTSYAFFESHDSFLIRLGELGREPLHIRMKLIDNAWRVVAIFDGP